MSAAHRMAPLNGFDFPSTPLTDADLSILADPSLADQGCLRRVDSPTGAEIVGRKSRGDFAGVVIPNIWPGSDHAREYRLRRDHPDLEMNGDGKPKQVGRYLSPPGRPNLLYFVPGTSPKWLQDTSMPMVALEGEKKGLAAWCIAWHGLDSSAARPRFVPFALPGVWSFKGTVGKAEGPNGERRDVKGTIPDLDKIAWSRRRVYILFDANVRTNESVEAARRTFAAELRRRGAIVSLVDLPEVGVNGFDDLVQLWGKDRSLEFLKTAIEGSAAESQAFAATELGNAERLVLACNGQARYCSALNSWLVFDGTRYRRDDDGEMDRRAKKMVRAIPLEAAAESRRAAKLRLDLTADGLSPERHEQIQKEAERADLKAQKLSKWALSSESASRIGNAIALAQSEPGIPVSTDELDQDPWAFNVLNGVINLRTGELLPHSPDRLITKLASVTYDPSASCPRWLAFLAGIFPEPYDDVIPFLQRAIGYSLTGRTSEECMFIAYGRGRNGKGSFIKVIDALMGDYAGTADSASFTPKKSDVVREDIADVVGKRFVSAQETREGAALDEALIKGLTGSDKISARRLYENRFEFLPVFKLWLSTNHKPEIRGTDAGIWSRIRLIPFTVSFEGRENKSLKDELLQELSGVLNWAIEGCLDWQKNGLGVPEAVAKANQEYKSECDQLQRYIDEHCVIGDSFTAGASGLYGSYKKWCESTGESVLTQTMFGRRLTERGYKKDRNSAGMIYRGIGFRSDEKGQN